MAKWNLALIAALFLVACVTTTTQGTLNDSEKLRVAEIQKIYSADFDAAVRADGLSVGQERFARTLVALPNSDRTGPVGAFYTLLEGLIFLQTNQLGKAQAIATEISEQTAALQTDGIPSRNVVLGQNYADLVKGHVAVSTLKGLNRDTLEQHAQRIEIVKDIETLNTTATRRLCKSGVTDDGAGFVAANLATYLVEADRALSRACIPTVTNAAQCAPFIGNRAQLVVARNLLATFADGLPDGSQISQMRRQIERDLSLANPGSPLGNPENVCG
jgi:hypothetical protein